MAAYQQLPYQTTVTQPVIVQPVPVVVPVMSGARWPTIRQGPAHLRNGAKLGSTVVPGTCVIFMCFIGCSFVVMSLFMLMTTHWDMSFWSKFDMSLPPTVIPAIVLGSIGVPLAIISCYLCTTAKKNYAEQQRQASTAPRSVPFTDPGNSAGNVYSGHGQPAVMHPVANVVGIGSSTYMPVQSPIVYPQQQFGISYPNTVSSLSYSGQMGGVHQPPQPGGTPYPGPPLGGTPYPGSPSYSVPEKAPIVPEYDQQPAYAPPAYAP